MDLFGRPAAAWPREMLRRRVGIVMQKASCSPAPSAPTCLWGNPQATDEQLWAALETAQAADFVRAKPLAWTSRWNRRPELFGRAAPALDHRPGPGQQPRYPNPGRQRQRPGLCHRRGPAQGHRRPARLDDRLYRQPACRQPAARRPHPGAGTTATWWAAAATRSCWSAAPSTRRSTRASSSGPLSL